MRQQTLGMQRSKLQGAKQGISVAVMLQEGAWYGMLVAERRTADTAHASQYIAEYTAGHI